MSRRIEIELTSSRPDGSWTWRAAGAREPKGVLDGTLLSQGSKPGDVVKAEAEFDIDGITIVSITQGRVKVDKVEKIVLVGNDKPFEAVTQQLAKKDRGDRRDRGDRARRRLVRGYPVFGGKINVPSDSWFAEDPVRLLEIFVLADTNGFEIHPEAMRIAVRDARLVDAVRTDPREPAFLSIAARVLGAMERHERAIALASRLPPFVTPVLLFVNEPATSVIATSALIAGATIQFHGDESPQDCLAATHQGARPYLRAARIPLGDGAASFDLVKYAHDYSHAQAILLDAHVEGYGGGGKAFNWSLLPPSVSSHLVLSGGLTPANVTDGILQVRPRCKTLAVDVSSGVEATDPNSPDGQPLKGIKDAGKIQRFIAAVRAADAQLAKNPHEFLSAT